MNKKALDVQRNILTVAGLMKEDNASVIQRHFTANLLNHVWWICKVVITFKLQQKK